MKTREKKEIEDEKKLKVRLGKYIEKKENENMAKEENKEKNKKKR